MKKIKKQTQRNKNSNSEIAMVFDGNRVTGVWYDPKLAPIICSLCGKDCKDKTSCFNTNPYCG